MTLPIQGISGLGGASPARPARSGGAGFGDVLQDALKQVDGMQQRADRSVENLATGRGGEVHDVILQATQADLAFRLMVEVRNKLVEGFQEVWRMPV